MQPFSPPPPAPAPQACAWHPDRVAGVICQRCDRPICPQCMHQASVGFHCPDCTKKGAQQVYRGVGALQQRPVVTEVLMALNVAAFVLGAILVLGQQEVADYLSGGVTPFHVDYASIAYLYQDTLTGAFGGGVGGGEWYRLVTSGFVHFGIIHLVVNMYSLWILGRVTEQLAGRARFAVIYGVALLGGSFGALLLSPQVLSAGASGAIFGLMGALFLAFRAQGVPMRNSPLLNVLVLNLIITFAIPSISKGGHIGGLIAGGIAGWVFFDLGRRPGLDPRIPYAICGALAVVLLVGSVAFANGYQPT